MSTDTAITPDAAAADLAEDLKHGLGSYLARAEDSDKAAGDFEESARRCRAEAALYRAKAVRLSEHLTTLGILHDVPEIPEPA